MHVLNYMKPEGQRKQPATGHYVTSTKEEDDDEKSIARHIEL